MNLRILDELKTSLNLNITIIKKSSENLLDKICLDTSVKLLAIKKNEKKYLKGMQIIIDQYVFDCINKEYKTDSLYSIEKNGMSLMVYEIILDNYILPPDEKNADTITEVVPQMIQKPASEVKQEDIYSFKVFDINAKCSFVKTYALAFFEQYQDNKIISIRSAEELGICSYDVVNFFESKGMKVLHAVCSEEMNYKPWSIFEKLFKDFYNLSIHKNFIPENSENIE